MTARLWAATQNGIHRFHRQAEWVTDATFLPGVDVVCLAVAGDLVVAGTEDGIWLTSDAGATWRKAEGLSVPHTRWIAGDPDQANTFLVGTEPAAMFRSEDGGAHWVEAPEVGVLRDQGKWFLPYSPRAGCIRGLAFHGRRVYAAAEVGGALRSDDGGRTWRLTAGSTGQASFDPPPEPTIHPDVHSVAAHPASADLVFAPTGGGFYVSADGGATWRSRYDCYCRAVWADPSDAGHLLLGPADGVDTDGRIEETRDGGASWTPASHGLKVPWRRHMVERFQALDGEIFAVLSSGEVYAAALADLRWRRVLREANSVRALAG
jgi:photosystem II stability/assembly factor-like uncharacterized protein